MLEQTSPLPSVELHGSSCHCYQLFYRAVVHMDQQAWAGLYNQYHRLIRHWLRDTPDDPEALVNQVFVRFWRALSPSRFADFDALEQILAYLRCCARSVAVDAQRRQARQQRIKRALAQTGQTLSVESVDHLLDKLISQGLYEFVQKRLNDAQERLVFRASYEWDMSPRHIAQRWPDDFDSARDVKRVKERILKRLRREAQLWKSWMSEN